MDTARLGQKMPCQSRTAGLQLIAYAILGVILLAACGGGSGAGGGTSTASSTGNGCTFAPRSGVFVNRVISYQPVNVSDNGEPATKAEWQFFYQPNTIEGPPCGDNANGQFDGVSLGWDRTQTNPTTLGGEIIVGFGDASGPRCIVDDGTSAPDFVVFGNQFFYLTGVYAKIATVEVVDSIPNLSDPDGASWVIFPPLLDSNFTDIQPAYYKNFAGVEPTSVGGDMFDLSVLSLGAGYQACYVRLRDGGTLWPDFSNTQTDQYEGGAAIDALQALNYSAPVAGLSP